MLSGTAPTPDGSASASGKSLRSGSQPNPRHLVLLATNVAVLPTISDAPADQDRARVAVSGSGEIQIGLDRAKVIHHVGPRPARYPEAVEVASQTPAEVSAVDSTRTANRGTTHDRHLAGRPVGELGLVALHQRAGRADRQPQSVGGLGAQRRVAEAEVRPPAPSPDGSAQPKAGLRQQIQRFRRR